MNLKRATQLWTRYGPIVLIGIMVLLVLIVKPWKSWGGERERETIWIDHALVWGIGELNRNVTPLHAPSGRSPGEKRFYTYSDALIEWKQKHKDWQLIRIIEDGSWTAYTYEAPEPHESGVTAVWLPEETMDSGWVYGIAPHGGVSVYWKLGLKYQLGLGSDGRVYWREVK